MSPGRCSSRKQDHASFARPPNHHEASLGISLLHLGQTRTQVSTLYASASVSTWQPDYLFFKHTQTFQWFPSVLRMKSKLHILVRKACLPWTWLWYCLIFFTHFSAQCSLSDFPPHSPHHGSLMPALSSARYLSPSPLHIHWRLPQSWQLELAASLLAGRLESKLVSLSGPSHLWTPLPSLAEFLLSPKMLQEAEVSF